MKMKTKLVVITSIYFLVVNLIILNAQVISVGEQLEYDVSYLGVSFAKVIISTERFENLNGKMTVKSKAKVYSYDHVPLVNLKADLETWFDRSGLFSHQFVRNLSVRKKPWEYQKVQFNYLNSTLRNQKWVKSKLVSALAFDIKQGLKLHDPLTSFFKLRQITEAYKSRQFYVYLDEQDVFNTSFNFAKDKQSIGVDAVDYKVRSIYCSGHPNWKGQYGIKGSVEAWISDDAARIPLMGKIDFIVGKINIELVKFKRNGWVPPKG